MRSAQQKKKTRLKAFLRSKHYLVNNSVSCGFGFCVNTLISHFAVSGVASGLLLYKYLLVWCTCLVLV